MKDDTGKFTADPTAAIRVADKDQILTVMFIKIRQYRHMPDGFDGNFGRYENLEVFDLVDDLAAVSVDDVAGMQAVCSDIQEILMTEVPMIPLWYNGLWAQWNDSVWANWPTIEEDTPNTLFGTWDGYWQMGMLLTFTTLEPAPQ